jgi:hypothetical protein
MRLTKRYPMDRMTIRLVGLSLIAIVLPELGYCQTNWRSVETWEFIALLLIPAAFGVIVACVISGPLGVRTWSPWGRVVTGFMAAAACLLNPVSLLTVMLAWAHEGFALFRLPRRTPPLGDRRRGRCRRAATAGAPQEPACLNVIACTTKLRRMWAGDLDGREQCLPRSGGRPTQQT